MEGGRRQEGGDRFIVPDQSINSPGWAGRVNTEALSAQQRHREKARPASSGRMFETGLALRLGPSLLTHPEL